MSHIKRRLRCLALALALAALPPAIVAAAEDPLRDVPANHWAYRAIEKLQADGLLQGYPDGTYKGQRPLTRYEMAVLTGRILDKLEKEFAEHPGAASAEDIALVRRMVDEFAGDLGNLKNDVVGLKSQVAKSNAAADRQQFHLFWFNRAPGFFRERVAAYDAKGSALAPQTPLKYGDAMGLLAQTASQSGEFAHGTGYETIRMIWSGNLDKKTSYAIRAEDRNYYSGPSAQAQNSTATACGGACAPNGNGYFFNQVFRLNYAYMTYADPSGLYAKVGRYVDADGPVGLGWTDYFQGAIVGYSKSGLNVYGGYSFNYTNGVAANLITGGPFQTILASVQDRPTSRLGLGLNYIIDRGVGNELLWNATTQKYEARYAPISLGSFNASYRFTPYLAVDSEFLHRFGKDPTTGISWKDENAVWLKGTVGRTTGAAGNFYAEGGFIGAGFNSTGSHTELEGTPDYQQFYLNNPNGYRWFYGGLHYRMGENARVGLVIQHFGLNPGTDLPLAGGGFISHDDGDAIVLQTLIGF